MEWTYKANWKESILPTLVFYAVVFCLGKTLIPLWNAAVYGQVSWMLFSAAAFAWVVVLGVLNVMMPMLSRFDNSLAGLLRNTVFVAMANLPGTLLVGMVSAAGVVLSAMLVFPVFFMPCLTALISSLFIEPMFRPYMNETSEDAA